MFLPRSTTIRSVLMNLTLTVEVTAWVSDEMPGFFRGEMYNDSPDYTVLSKSFDSKPKPKGSILRHY